MADDHDDLAEWRGNIASRVSTLEETATIQARARAGMDRDMSDLKTEFRAQRQLLQALAKTQSDHTKMLRALGERYSELKLDVASGHEMVMAGLQTVIGLLDREPDVTPGPGENSSTPE